MSSASPSEAGSADTQKPPVDTGGLAHYNACSEWHGTRPPVTWPDWCYQHHPAITFYCRVSPVNLPGSNIAPGRESQTPVQITLAPGIGPPRQLRVASAAYTAVSLESNPPLASRILLDRTRCNSPARVTLFFQNGACRPGPHCPSSRQHDSPSGSNYPLVQKHRVSKPMGSCLTTSQ